MWGSEKRTRSSRTAILRERKEMGLIGGVRVSEKWTRSSRTAILRERERKEMGLIGGVRVSEKWTRSSRTAILRERERKEMGLIGGVRVSEKWTRSSRTAILRERERKEMGLIGGVRASENGPDPRGRPFSEREREKGNGPDWRCEGLGEWTRSSRTAILRERERKEMGLIGGVRASENGPDPRGRPFSERERERKWA
ncbi:hypothetical protein RRG08_053715 [Elysia crispata]|uniref:Uncharacterized protein n=1 Tax=Elysia crispata TaxID=231223 RepID=A0AAE0XXV4_9GAST|nr:hypothetical protein RRG08_053715 [Elysia crispata]